MVQLDGLKKDGAGLSTTAPADILFAPAQFEMRRLHCNGGGNKHQQGKKKIQSIESTKKDSFQHRQSSPDDQSGRSRFVPAGKSTFLDMRFAITGT